MYLTSRITVAALTLLGAASAFAQEATSDAWQTIASTQACGQAAADMAQARQDGTLHFGDTGYFEPVVSVKTRADVVAATMSARNSGELASINAEAYRGFMPAAAVQMARAGR